MKKAFQCAVFVLGLALLVPVARAQQKSFKATLSGASQVPVVQTSANGQATFRLSPNGKSISYTLTVMNLNETTMAHIHLAAAGKNGPPVVWLYPTKAYPVKHGRVNGLLARGVITAAQLVGPLKGKTIEDLVQQMREGNTYVNVHTKAHPGGEIRGQIH